MKEATHIVSACYFPKSGEAELTWERLQDGKLASMTVKVTSAQGMQLAETVPACVYWDATIPPHQLQLVDALREAREFVDRHSEDWYQSGQRLLTKIDAALAPFKPRGDQT